MQPYKLQYCFSLNRIIERILKKSSCTWSGAKWCMLPYKPTVLAWMESLSALLKNLLALDPVLRGVCCPTSYNTVLAWMESLSRNISSCTWSGAKGRMHPKTLQVCFRLNGIIERILIKKIVALDLELRAICNPNNSRTSVTQTSLGPWKFIWDMGSSSPCGLIMAAGQEANDNNLGMSFWFSIQ